MLQYVRYLNSINLTAIADQLISNVIASENADRDFEQVYKWRSFETAFEEAKVSRKPIFLLIHKSWCSACRQLKIKLSKSVRLIDLSNQFVMVNIESDEKPVRRERKFYPDGKYVPRILFFTPDGELIKEAYNRHEKALKQYKYFYSSPSQIIESMLYVLKNYSENFSEKLDETSAKKITFKNLETDDDIAPTVLE